jgi:2-C-methyl-D-erythritol 4-phosphate cytidylyltransferase
MPAVPSSPPFVALASPAGQAAVHVVIPAAGVGARAAANGPKQYALLLGQPLVAHTVAAFLATPGLARLCAVVAPGDTAWPLGPSRLEVLPLGGDSRAASVLAGLRHLLSTGADQRDWVMVHDAARCLITPSQIERLVSTCQGRDHGGLLAVPLPDTLKQANPQGQVSATLERADKWLAQTPQMFRLGALAQALSGDLAGVTDEASAMERMGYAPLLVQGSAMNFKVTYPDDFALAQAVLASRVSTGENGSE